MQKKESDIMDFMTAVSTCFRKYATFSGRARRSEYWYFSLFTTVVSTALSLIFGDQAMIASLFALVTLLPGLAVTWRRMHDIGKSGAWSLLVLLPIIGTIIVLIWECKDSQPGSNAYGPNPKGV